jgi:hypothetical protein
VSVSVPCSEFNDPTLFNARNYYDNYRASRALRSVLAQRMRDGTGFGLLAVLLEMSSNCFVSLTRRTRKPDALGFLKAFAAIIR